MLTTTKTSATSNSVQSKVQIRFASVEKLSMKVSSKIKVHRRQLLSKSSMNLYKLHSGFLEFTKIYLVRTIPLAFKSSNSRIASNALMHSNVSIQIDSQTHSYGLFAHSGTFRCHQDVSKRCSRFRIYSQTFIATKTQLPKDTVSPHPRMS